MNKEELNKIPHFVKNSLHVNCLCDGFVVYNVKTIIFKYEVITPIRDLASRVHFCQKQINKFYY